MPAGRMGTGGPRGEGCLNGVGVGSIGSELVAATGLAGATTGVAVLKPPTCVGLMGGSRPNDERSGAAAELTSHASSFRREAKSLMRGKLRRGELFARLKRLLGRRR